MAGTESAVTRASGADSRSPCRVCLLRDMAERADVYGYVLKTRAMLSEKERADDALYERRLALCRACPHLLAATCLKCGCYVEIRAAARRSRCPLTERKW